MPDFDPKTARAVRKGNAFEDFEEGRVFRHHWGRTFNEGDNSLFSATTLFFNPLYFNKEYAKEQDALFKLHGEASLGPGGFEQHTVPKEKQPELIRDLQALRAKFAKAISEQEEKNKKFDEKAKATKADVVLKKVSEGLIKKEVPKLSTAHALGILEMIEE